MRTRPRTIAREDVVVPSPSRMAGDVHPRASMSIVETIWSAAHASWWAPRWEVFQLAAVVAGAVAVAARDGRLLRPYAVGVTLAAMGAVVLGSGSAWASFVARGGRDGLPELEVAGFGALAGLVAGYATTVWVASGRTSVLVALDALAPATGLMTALARIGCFFAGCDFGAPSSVPWALRYPAMTPAFRAQLDAGLVRATDTHTLPVHPTQLYEALAGLGVLAIAVAWNRRHRARSRAGSCFVVAMLAYVGARFGIDFLRGDLARGALGLTTTQWYGVAIALGVLLCVVSARASRRPDDLPSSPGSHRSRRPTASS